jgi:hypothetical protein
MLISRISRPSMIAKDCLCKPTDKDRDSRNCDQTKCKSRCRTPRLLVKNCIIGMKDIGKCKSPDKVNESERNSSDSESRFHDARLMAPNAPKLSDGGGRRGSCMVSGKVVDWKQLP